jgi:hypothetical protein
MFISHETLLNPVEEHECIGSGAYLAKHWIRQYQIANPGRITLEDAALTASMAVKAAIDYDEYCGGEAEMIIVNNTGEVDESCDCLLYPGFMVEKLQDAALKFVHDLAHIKDGLDIETDRLLTEYLDRIRAITASNKWALEALTENRNTKNKQT